MASPPPSTSGRPIDSGRTTAILKASLKGLADLGYDRLSMEEIAARAQAGKATLYRRWPSKAALIVDAIKAWREEQAPMLAPDTGSVIGDLDALAALVPDFDKTGQQQLSMILSLTAAATHDSELAAVLPAALLQRPRLILRQVLDQAVARGEISATHDLNLLVDAMIGLHLLRMLQGTMPDSTFVQNNLRTLVEPLIVSRGRTSRPRKRSTTQ